MMASQPTDPQKQEVNQKREQNLVRFCAFVADCSLVCRPVLQCRCSRPISVRRRGLGGGIQAPGRTTPRRRPRRPSSSAPSNSIPTSLISSHPLRIVYIADDSWVTKKSRCALQDSPSRVENCTVKAGKGKELCRCLFT